MITAQKGMVAKIKKLFFQAPGRQEDRQERNKMDKKKKKI